MDRIVDGLYWFLAFLFSTTVHEAMHALVALRGGDPTAYRGGQVSISPIPHIRREPIGMLLVPLVTAFYNGWAIGWASAPVDTAWAERHPRRAALVSAAGPVGNLLIALIAWIGIRIGLGMGAFEAPPSPVFAHLTLAANGNPHSLAAFAAQGLSVLVTLNVFLAAFNLLPLPPLDGGSAVLGILPKDLADQAAPILRSPGLSIVGFVVAWQLFPKISGPLFHMLVASLYPGQYVFR
ncbi:MAG TPA: site-2 protease family protein [Polyangia bacterium]|nr:site-2 protease family protein [Polyangia bacterium]